MDADFGSLEANECTIQRNTLHTKWIFIYLSHTKYFQLLLLIKYESVVSGSGFSFRCRCGKMYKNLYREKTDSNGSLAGFYELLCIQSLNCPHMRFILGSALTSLKDFYYK